MVTVAVAHTGVLGAERGPGAGSGGAALCLRGARHPSALRILCALLAAPPAGRPRPRPGKHRPLLYDLPTLSPSLFPDPHPFHFRLASPTQPEPTLSQMNPAGSDPKAVVAPPT